MRDIRDKFVAAIEDTARTTMGVFYVWIKGGVAYRKFYESTLTAKIQLAADESTPIPYAPTHEEVIAALDARPYIVVETFQGLAIQQWHEFLADVYRDGVRRSLDATGGVQLKSVSFKLRVDRLGVATLADAVADAARDEFDFSENEAKLDRVSRMLNRGDAMQDPDISAHRAVIKQNVLVRNALQHNGGVVREEDVRRNGGPFTCDSGKATHSIGVGQQVHRTVFDLAKCVQSMVVVANALIV